MEQRLLQSGPAGGGADGVAKGKFPEPRSYVLTTLSRPREVRLPEPLPALMSVRDAAYRYLDKCPVERSKKSWRVPMTGLVRVCGALSAVAVVLASTPAVSRDGIGTAGRIAGGLKAAANQNRYVTPTQLLGDFGINKGSHKPMWSINEEQGVCRSGFTCYRSDWINPDADDAVATVHLGYSPGFDTPPTSVESFGTGLSARQCLSPEALARRLDGKLDVAIRPGLAEPWAPVVPSIEDPEILFKAKDGRTILLNYGTRDKDHKCIAWVRLSVLLSTPYQNMVLPNK